MTFEAGRTYTCEPRADNECMQQTATINETEQITPSRAARVLELSEGMVRLLADRGQLPCTRVGSLRLFNLRDVLRVRALRAETAR